MPLSNYGLGWMNQQPMQQPNMLSSAFQSWGSNIPTQGGGQLPSYLASNQAIGSAMGNNGVLPSGFGQTDNAGGGLWSMDALLGNSETGQQGWGMPAISAITGIGGLALGMKQFGLAKQAFKESKNQFNMNFDAMAQTVDRQIANDYKKGQAAARVSGVGGSDLSQAEYMSQWGVSNRSNRKGTGA